MKLLVISLCTQGIMREHFIYYCKHFSKTNELYCITNDNVTNQELEAIETLNLSYKRDNPIGYFSIGKLYKIKKFINAISPDVIYIFTHHATSILIAPIVKRYRLIYQVHDPIPHEGVGKLNGWIIKKQLRIYSKIANKLVVAGDAIKNQILSIYKVDPNKIIPIPLAVIDSLILPESDTIDCQVDVLFFGRIEPYKGLDTLIEAIKKMDFKPETFIVGGGNIIKAFPMIKEIPSNIHIMGFLEDSELVKYIKASKIIVLPYHEATGTMTVGQAFYYGRPVIASDVGTLPEYVSDGGLIFEHGNSEELKKCMEKLLNDEKLRKKLSMNASKLYESSFTIEKACMLHDELYMELLKETEE